MGGNIDIDIRATGMVLSRATMKQKNDPNCIEDCLDFVAYNMVAPEHQHFFCYRIDFDIEGTKNMLTEVDIVNLPRSLDNLDGGAFSVRRTIIPTETSRDYNAVNARSWSVINPSSRNKYNTPRGYAVQPTNVAYTYICYECHIHDGDEPRPDPDFGLCQLDATMGKTDWFHKPLISILVTFGEHPFHHLFPTVCHSKLEYLKPIVYKTLQEFGENLPEASQLELFLGAQEQMRRTEGTSWNLRKATK